MLNVEIRRPRLEDKEKLHHFFRAVISDTFTKEGIRDKLDDLEAEVKMKKHYLESDLATNGQERYFLIAVTHNQIIGSVEFGPASELIQTCTNNALTGLPEVGTVFVHPDHQKKGVGNQLLKAIYARLQEIHYSEFCLDSGYPQAQTIWSKKFGQPNFLLKDYWGEGFDHMIWRVKLTSIKTK